MIKTILSICVGSCIGSLIRWRLSILFNHFFTSIPPGTLLVNMLGGYLIGVIISIFSKEPCIAAKWHAPLITGFLGSLTTFSSFSLETTLLIKQSRFLWAIIAILAHVAGSLIMTLLGFASVMLFKST